ncbi:MAG: glutathione synthase [SAR324 cluster bacterium]|nr:glutathione synthase [SAR324 cluster bacterium]
MKAKIVPNRLQETIDFALMNGLIKFNTSFQLVHAPFVLAPYSLSKDVLEKMVSLTPSFNDLMLRVASNQDFLTNYLEQASLTDSFIKGLMSIYLEKKSTQPYQFLLGRNDFMMVEDANYPKKLQPKQVEFNTISVSFPYLSTQLNHLHQFMYEEQPLGKKLVLNDPLTGIVDAIALAVQQYGHSDSCVLQIVQPREQNIFDQRGGEYKLWQKHRIPTIRMTLEEVAKEGACQEGHLMIQGKVAAVTYLRAGYSPGDYQTPDAWKGRRLIESSSSISAPSVAMQLAGMKKIQQVLTDPKILKNFVEQKKIQEISDTFVGMHLLDEMLHRNGQSDLAQKIACDFPDKYVLKPQREGGGNNFFDQEMVKLLHSLTKEEYPAYILMERIDAKEHQAVLVVEGKIQETSCISEIGCYGVCLAKEKDILLNQDVGYLVRTKAADQNEGGVCAGYACLNSLCIR